MSGRHRQEPVRRPLLSQVPPLLTQVPRPVAAAAGVGVTLMAVTAGVSFWPEGDAGKATAAFAAVEAGSTESAGELRAATAARDAQRASRDKARVSIAAKPVLPEVTGKLWVETAVNVRSAPSRDGDRIGSLEALGKVAVSGVTSGGWTQVVVGKKAGWVRSTYLSKTKPKPPEPKTPAGVSGAACSISTDIEQHLSTNARAVYRAVCAAFDTVSSYGGYRAGDDGDHGSGRALDIMISGDPGWDIVRYVQAHASELGVTYVIYQQKMWFAGHPTGDWEQMENRGSTTANHFDHVHVSVS